MVQTVKRDEARKLYNAGVTVWLAQAELPHHVNGQEHIGIPINRKGNGAFEAEVKGFRVGMVPVLGALTFRVKK